jgi:hypothetical protein
LVQQLLCEKPGSSLIGAQPVLAAKESMNLVGDDEFLKWRVLQLEAVRQFDSLIEGHIPVIIALNQQYR